MTQQFTGGNEPEPQGAAVPEALPQQEEFYRAPARFGAVPVEAEPKGWDRRGEGGFPPGSRWVDFRL